jgi:hypothetical protein
MCANQLGGCNNSCMDLRYARTRFVNNPATAQDEGSELTRTSTCDISYSHLAQKRTKIVWG